MYTPPHMTRLCLLACLVCLSLCVLSVPAAMAAQPEPFARLFGVDAYIAEGQDFPLHIKKHWLKVLKAEKDAPCLQKNASRLPQPDASHWLNLTRQASTMDAMSRLRAVNAFFNKFPASTNQENFGDKDRWPSMEDFFNRRAGDRKAYALSKYFALRALGVPDDKLRIVLAHLPERKAPHAVLAVATDKGVFILDNDVQPLDLILPQEKFNARFIPLLMFNEKGRWIFRQNMDLLNAR